MEVEDRMKLIQDLDSFIKDKQNILDKVLQQLEWKEESLMDEIKVPCGSNAGHWIPQSTACYHQKLCEWIEEGYTKEEFAQLCWMEFELSNPSHLHVFTVRRNITFCSLHLQLKKEASQLLKLEKGLYDSSFPSEESSEVTSVVIDAATQEKVLLESGLISKVDQIGTLNFPKTIDRWTVQLNPEQRLAIYDYAVKVTKAAKKEAKNLALEDLIIDFEKKEEQDEKPKSELEILAEMRDYKRRRQSYRAKNVHITKKSYTEIMKEVIENQTSYLAEITKHSSSQNRKTNNEVCEDQTHGEMQINSHNEESSSSGISSKYKRKYSEYTEYKEDSRKHRSKHESSKKKHKNRSRSRSPSRHKHKKSHKRKRSYDSD